MSSNNAMLNFESQLKGKKEAALRENPNDH